MVFHYGLEAFEGLKAYLDEKKDIRLFRPEKNMERLNSSAKRLALPVSFVSCLLEMGKRP